MFKSIGNNGHLESIVGGIAHGQADTIDRYRAFVYRDVAALCHLLVKSIPESKVIASFRILYIDASGSLVHMSLNDMAIQPAVHHHTTLHIHFISHLQQAKIGTVQRFLHGRHGIGIICQTDYRQANTIVRHTLVYF